MTDAAAPFGLDLSPLLTGFLAYGILLVRPITMLTFIPAFARVQFTPLLRSAVASALLAPVLPLAWSALERAKPSVFGLAALAGKEALIGFALAVVLGAPFWVLDIAGDYLDAQRGATQGRLNDPAGFSDVSITGTLLTTAAVAIFVATGGLQTLTDLLYRSWAIWKPLGAFPQLDARTPDLLLGLLDRITRQGLLLSLPLVVAMLLGDAGLAIVSRLAPQLRIDDMALALRNIIFIALLPAYAMFLIVYVRQDFGSLPGFLDLLRDAAPARAP